MEDPELVEKRLRASEARLRAILDSEPECVKTVSLDGRLLEMNPAGLRMIEADDAAAVLGQRVDKLVHAEDRAAYLELHRRVARGETGQIQFRVVGLKGAERWMEIHSVPLRGEDGAVASVLSVTRDISERRQAEEALRASEDRYRDLVENSRDLMCTHDLGGQLLSVNEAAVRFTGYSRAALLQMNLADLLAPEVRGGFGAYLEAIGTTGRASGVMRIRTAAGETRYWNYSNSLRTEGVSVPVVRGLVQDVTDAKQARAALRQSEAKYRALIENMAEGLLLVDQDEIIRFVNPRVCRMLGYSEAELLGQDATDLLFREEDKAAMAARNRRRAEGIAEGYEIEVRKKSGEFFWASFSVTPIQDADSRTASSMAIVADITERKQAETALHVSEERYRTLFDRNLAGVYRTTLDGRVLECNEAFAHIFGYASREEALSADVNECYPTSGIREAFLELLKAGGAVFNHEFEGRRRDGSAVWLLENSNWIQGGELAAGGIIEGTLLDITERKAMEAELRQSQKIEAIGRLAGGVAHDFNNILGVILGYGELAASELAPESPVRELVAEMVEAAERAATLTRQLQAFSRKQILQPRRLDLNELIVNAHKLLDRLIGEDIALVALPAPELGTVLADPGQIDQILLNLAINARDAMPQGGTLTLETANMEIHADYAAEHWPAKPGRYVMVAISDTGIGMDAETQRRIFEPFFTTKPVGQGTGLGLATVYGIVKQSEGYIWVYSEPGLGTTFKIFLPRVDELPDDKRSDAAAEVAAGGHETILLVEDNPALREVTRRQLAASGYSVLVAVDGEAAEALAGAYAGTIDLLLTDVVMPKLGGGELAERLAASRPGLPVLFMSGYTDGALAQHGVLKEGVALLEKPFSGEKLVRAVRELLDRPSRSQEAGRL